VRLVATNVGPDKKLPPDGAVVLSFDRMLLPLTVVRQSFFIVDAFNVALSPTVQYDPVNRVVTLGNPSPNGSEWLKRNQPYKLVLTVPSGDEDTNGVRAIDRAPLDPASERVIAFFVDTAPAGVQTAPSMNFCNDVLPIFQNHCSASQCHGAPTTTPPSSRFPDGKTRPAAGLVLETTAGLEATAINRVAEGSNTGPRTVPRPPGHVFGFDVPLVEPGDPGNSWLLYKLLIAPPPPAGTAPSQRLKCDGTPGTAPHAPFQPAVAYASLADDERARLSDFITGNVMPYPANPGSTDRGENLSLDELQRISTWIAQGARTANCGTCEP